MLSHMQFSQNSGVPQVTMAFNTFVMVYLDDLGVPAPDPARSFQVPPARRQDPGGFVGGRLGRLRQVLGRHEGQLLASLDVSQRGRTTTKT